MAGEGQDKDLQQQLQAARVATQAPAPAQSPGPMSSMAAGMGNQAFGAMVGNSGEGPALARSPQRSPREAGAADPTQKLLAQALDRRQADGASTPPARATAAVARLSVAESPTQLARAVASRREAAATSPVGGRTAVLARRNDADDMQAAADRSTERDDAGKDDLATKVGQISSVNDATSAKFAIGTVENATKVLQGPLGASAGATPGHIAQNQTTISTLESLVDRSNVLDVKADRFSQLYRSATGQWERLDAAVSAFLGQHGPPEGVDVDDKGKVKWQGKQVSDEARKGTTDDKQASEHPDRKDAEAAMRDTKGVLDRLQNKSGEFDANVAGLAAASDAVRADEGRIPNDEKDNAATKDVEKQAAAFKATVGTVLSMLKKVAAQLPIGAAAVTALTPSISSATPEERAESGRKVYKPEDIDKPIQDASIPEFLSLENMIFGDKKKLAALIDADDMTRKNFAHTKQALDRVEEQTAKLATTMADIKALMKDLDVQTARIRKASKAAGEEYDKKHGTGGKGAAAGVLYGEAAAFVSYAMGAADQGKREKEEAGRVKGQRDEIASWQNPANASGAGGGMVDPAGMKYHFWTKDKGRGAKPDGYIADGHINASKLTTMGDNQTSGAAIETTDKALDDLRGKVDQAQDMRNSLGKMLGMF